MFYIEISVFQMRYHVDVLLLRIIRHPLALEDDDITLVFFPGVQLATGKKGRFLYVFDRAAEANLLQHNFRQSLWWYSYRVPTSSPGLVMPKPFDTGPSRSRQFVPHLATLIRTPRSIF